MNLWEFINEGGWGMYPTLIFGLITATTAARFAWTPERKRLGFIAGMWATTLVQIAHATWTDFAAVFRVLSGDAIPREQLVRVLFEGLKECTRPGILGGLFLVASILFVSIGTQRASAHAEA
jgi:hypothetical protein